MSKQLKIIFLLSISLNVLLLGVLVGYWSHYFGKKYLREQYIASHIEKLPATTQERIRTVLKEIHSANERSYDELNQSRKELLRIVKTEPFDEAAYERQVTRIGELRDQMRRRTAQAVKELAQTLPAEERELLPAIFNHRQSRLFPSDRRRR